MEDRLWKHKKYSKREAWCWLIENANYDDCEDFVKGKIIKIPRGTLIKTERQLADKWKWGRQRVRTFLKTLQKDEKIVLKLTQRLTQISIMNYNIYQESQPNKEPSDNPKITQQQPSLRKELKELKEVKEDMPPYAFEGNLIKLNSKDYEKWRKIYSAIPDFEATLYAADSWISDKPAKEQKKWFCAVSQYLNNQHQKHLNAKQRHFETVKYKKPDYLV